MRFQVEEAGAGRRLDVFLSENTELTRSRLEKLIKGGSVLDVYKRQEYPIPINGLTKEGESHPVNGVHKKSSL